MQHDWSGRRTNTTELTVTATHSQAGQRNDQESVLAVPGQAGHQYAFVSGADSIQAGPGHVDSATESNLSSVGKVQRIGNTILPARAWFQALFLGLWCQVGRPELMAAFTL